jgi:hypothetical protein
VSKTDWDIVNPSNEVRNVLCCDGFKKAVPRISVGPNFFSCTRPDLNFGWFRRVAIKQRVDWSMQV